MDSRAKSLIERAIAGLGNEHVGRLYFDLEAPAAYRLEPGEECTAALHPRCPATEGEGYVTLKLGAPRHEVTRLPCGGCGAGLELHPPPEVLAFGRSGIHAGQVLPH